EGMFALDVLTVHPGAQAGVELRIGEIKVYPDRGGYTDPGELASARAQAGLYVHVVRLAVSTLGLDPGIRVANAGFLVLLRPGGNRPSIRAREDLRWQARRAEVAFERLRRATSHVSATDVARPDAALRTLRDTPTAYCEGCVAFCPRTPR